MNHNDGIQNSRWPIPANYMELKLVFFPGTLLSTIIREWQEDIIFHIWSKDQGWRSIRKWGATDG